MVVVVVAITLNGPLLLRGLLYFPDERAPASRWVRLSPWIFALGGVTALGLATDALISMTLARRLEGALNVAFQASGLFVVTWKFHRAGPIGRRQIKWVALGIYLATAPVFFGQLFALTRSLSCFPFL
jgi:hypothetical protein